MLYWTANMNIISGSHFRTRLGMKHETAPPRIPTGTGVAVEWYSMYMPCWTIRHGERLSKQTVT